MNRIVLIGNGFDLAHGLKTSYKDFINWYWDYRRDLLPDNLTTISEDILCKLEIIDKYSLSSWHVFAFHYSCFQNLANNKKTPGIQILKDFINNKAVFSVQYSSFLKSISESIETKGWVDIENEYYNLLTKYAFDESSKDKISSLNDQLKFLTDLLVEYLKSVDKQGAIIDGIFTKIYAPVNARDISVNASNYDSSDIERIMLLSFNYTNTAKMYLNKNIISELIYIHGKTDEPQSVIFGYGDELDTKFKDLQNLNNDDCLNNIKTIRYLETDNYRSVLAFMESAPYQVYIMGHSCGNSDRTLLNTLFEHKNCISIKPYYYQKENGMDNYIELAQNISRNFTDMKLMRDKVVNKQYCECLC